MRQRAAALVVTLVLCALEGCGYRWGRPTGGGGLRSTHRALLQGPGRFELRHDGDTSAGRSFTLSELLWSYREEGGALEALQHVNLRLTLSSRPLSPTHASLDGRLSVSAQGGAGAQLATLEASLIRAQLAPLGGMSAPPESDTRALCRALGAQLAHFTRARDMRGESMIEASERFGAQ